MVRKRDGENEDVVQKLPKGKNAGGVISELGEQQEKEAGNGNGLEV